MLTKTYIRSRLTVLVTDRQWCMDHGEMEKTMDLQKICSSLNNELDWTAKQGHNAHTALVRRNAAGIRKLAWTLGRKHNLRTEVLAMVDSLAGSQFHNSNFITHNPST